MIISLIFVFILGLAIGFKIGWDIRPPRSTIKNLTINADREELIDVIESFDALEELKKQLKKDAHE